MRVLDKTAKAEAQKIIDQNLPLLKAAPGFVSAEPGFPLVDGAILKEPSIIVFVSRKLPVGDLLPEDRLPRQLGQYRVAVMQADPERQVFASQKFDGLAARLTQSSADLTYEGIDGDPIDEKFEISEPMLCHVGPDAGWPVLKPFLEATEKTLSVAMYDFNADYIAKSFIETVRDKELNVVLTWDDGMTAPETKIRTRLRRTLKEQLDGWIVQCGNGYRFANAYHEKVAVRDSSAFWLSSGNWSLRSQPDIDPIADPKTARGMFSKGNREWHIIVDDGPLSEMFERYIRHDRDGSEAEAKAGDKAAKLDKTITERMPDLFVPILALVGSFELAAPPQPFAPASLPSVRRKVEVMPVLTPDNYLHRILDLIKSAKRSIYLQYAYITYSDRPDDKKFTEMLGLLADLSYKPNFEMRIIVGASGAADKIRKLVEAGFNEKVFHTQSSIHNKGIVVDGSVVLVSSANWSSDGVLRNRDAGLIIYDEEIASYYSAVFEYDWDTRSTSHIEDDEVAVVASVGEEIPAGMVRMSWRDYYG
jgi:hypothetical protein